MTALGAGVGPPICVLGMGRSGTSLTARALNLLGVDLGPSERMLEVNDWNPAGFWEQRPIMDLNDEILTRLGGSYELPPELPDGWHRDPGMSEFHERASALVAELFPSDRRWGFKDPRTVITLPFWKDVVGAMHYVICARDPFEVARSHCVGFEQHTAEHFLGLWLRHNAAALRQTEGEHRAVVLYDEWHGDPDVVTRRLRRLVTGTDEPADEKLLAAVRATVQPDLHRQRADRGMTPAESALELRAMMSLLTALAVDPDPRAAAPLSALADDLEADWHARRALEGRLEDTVAALTAADARRAAAEAEHARLQGESERLMQELQRSTEALETIHASRSWRATAPLRRGARRFRALG
jgi:hypothetical protein